MLHTFLNDYIERLATNSELTIMHTIQWATSIKLWQVYSHTNITQTQCQACHYAHYRIGSIDTL